MVSANIALIIMIVVIFLLALILPLLDSVKCFKDSISTRWSIVVVYLSLGVGCVVDFETMSDETRHFVLLGCFVMSILYVVFISIERWFSNKWIGNLGITLKKGDATIHAGVSDNDTKLFGTHKNDGKQKVKDGKKKDDKDSKKEKDFDVSVTQGASYTADSGNEETESEEAESLDDAEELQADTVEDDDNEDGNNGVVTTVDSLRKCTGSDCK